MRVDGVRVESTVSASRSHATTRAKRASPTVCGSSGDLFDIDFSGAMVVTFFLMPKLNQRGSRS